MGVELGAEVGPRRLVVAVGDEPLEHLGADVAGRPPASGPAPAPAPARRGRRGRGRRVARVTGRASSV